MPNQLTGKQQHAYVIFFCSIIVGGYLLFLWDQRNRSIAFNDDLRKQYQKAVDKEIPNA